MHRAGHRIARTVNGKSQADALLQSGMRAIIIKTVRYWLIQLSTQQTQKTQPWLKKT